uniref:Uncharacterized protein n=1 Tax=Arundo donax TaxID=35708 RepID=A0A0A9GNW7_ARUDO
MICNTGHLGAKITDFAEASHCSTCIFISHPFSRL